MYKARRKAANDHEFRAGMKSGTCLPKNLIILRRVLKSSFLNFKFRNCDCLTFSGETCISEIAFDETIAESILSAAFVLVMIIDSPILSLLNSGSQASPNEMSANSPVWSGHIVQRVGVKKMTKKRASKNSNYPQVEC